MIKMVNEKTVYHNMLTSGDRTDPEGCFERAIQDQKSVKLYIDRSFSLHPVSSSLAYGGWHKIQQKYMLIYFAIRLN